MNRRFDAKTRSSAKIEARVTPDEAEEARALAAYLKMSMSNLLRELFATKRKELIAAGHRPPRRLKESVRS